MPVQEVVDGVVRITVKLKGVLGNVSIDIKICRNRSAGHKRATLATRTGKPPGTAANTERAMLNHRPTGDQAAIDDLGRRYSAPIDPRHV